MYDFGLFLNGKQENASNPEKITINSPADGSPIGSVPRASAEEAQAAVSAAKTAFATWSDLSAYERQKIINKATAFVRTKADDIGLIMAKEQGKPLKQSVGEVYGSCDTLDYFAAQGVRVEGTINQTEKKDLYSFVVYQPVGVCALITPWNYPLSLLSWKLGPALAVGCTAVVKPTSTTPLCPMAFCEALTDGGIPAGVINVITGGGRELSEPLLCNPDVAKIAMTGSSNTGKNIMKAAAPFLKKVSLELGGHAPAIVAQDANCTLAAQIVAYKGFRNMGQSCSSVNRVYVHESRFDEFVQKLKEIAESLTIGDGVTDGTVDLGPMTTASGRETVQKHIQDALDKGATLVTGGKIPEGTQYEKGNYFTPTILTDITSKMIMMKEETFGPVVPVCSFSTIDEAIEMANDTEYGLAAYLFTASMETTMSVSEKIEAGTVCVNNGAVNTNYAPYAGWKNSGYGFELSPDAVMEYLKKKHIKIKLK